MKIDYTRPVNWQDLIGLVPEINMSEEEADKVLDMLSELECDLRYASWAEPENDALQEAHAAANRTLVQFAAATKCERRTSCQSRI